MSITNIFNKLQRDLSKTSVDDDFLPQRDDKDNSEVPPIIPLSRSEDETKANSDEDKPPTPLKKKGRSEDKSSPKANSDEDKPPIPLKKKGRSEDESPPKANSGEDKPPTPLKKKGPTDRFARDCRIGFKELGDKGGKNIKEGMKKAGQNVKEGMKEAAEKVGDKVKEGLKDMSVKITITSSLLAMMHHFLAILLIINFTWLGAFLLWLYH